MHGSSKTFFKENAQQTVRGVVMQEAEQVGDSPEDVDADIQRKRIR